MHYYSFNISDYRRDTVHLSHEEHYIYRALIDIYYESEKPLLLDKRQLLRLLSCTTDQLDTLDNVLNDFFIETEKGYKHPRIEAELAKIYQKSEKARQSVNKRWAKHTNVSKNDTNVIRTHNECNTKAILPNNLVTYPRIKDTERVGKFLPPTLAELKDYQQEAGLKFDPEQFIDFYTSNGWKVSGRAAMKDWKASARNWAKREKKYEADKGTTKSHHAEVWNALKDKARD